MSTIRLGILLDGMGFDDASSRAVDIDFDHPSPGDEAVVMRLIEEAHDSGPAIRYDSVDAFISLIRAKFSELKM